MANVEPYRGRRLRLTAAGSSLRFAPDSKKIQMWAVLWRSGEPWLEATTYLRRRAFEADTMGGAPKTVANHAECLASYASFLEINSLDWFALPEDKSGRPYYLYRGDLLKKCNARGGRGRNTAALHMSVVRSFYAWAMKVGALRAEEHLPFQVRPVFARIPDAVGVQRSVLVLSSDLAIKRASNPRRGVEEGCSPLKLKDRDQVLKICREGFRDEFNLAMKLGFFSGIRIGTIHGLTYTALRKNFDSQDLPGWKSISVGPEYGIPTKGGVNYFPSMPEPLLRELLEYCKLVRRARRAKSALEDDRDLVLLGNRGQRLNSRSLSADMTLLRRLAAAEGLSIPWFHFHCSRATFGTAFVLASMQCGHKSNQIFPRLMRLMGHTNAGSSKNYIDFVENEAQMEADAEAYVDFLGLPRLN